MISRCMRVRAFSAVTLSMVLVAPATLEAQDRSSACYPLDSVATRFIAWGTLVGSGTDSSAAQARRRLRVPATAASTVAPVTDVHVCGKLAGAYSMAVSVPVTRVYAIKIGQVYAVFDPAVKGGEWNIVVTFDSKYRELGSALH